MGGTGFKVSEAGGRRCLLELINSLVEEGVDIIVNRKVTREEVEWLARFLTNIEKRRTIGVVAEVDGKIVGNSEVMRGMGAQSHVGFLGIIIARGYSDIGIGTRMLETLVEESRRAGLRLLVHDVYASNTRMCHVYSKLGFMEGEQYWGWRVKKKGMLTSSECT